MILNQADKNILERFSKNRIDTKEEQYVYNLFSENEEDREFKKYFLTKWKNYLGENTEENYNLGFLLDRIHHIIHKNENKKEHSTLKKIYKWYSAAAALLIPVIIAGSILFAERNLQEPLQTENPVISTLIAPRGSRISFSLPDGTHGWLNSGSSMEYSLPFKNNRKVNILGEAWFDVSHDKVHPFEVIAGDSKVKVLGTKFNLNAYPEDKYIEIVLEEGKVEFSVPGLLSDIEMKPDERLVFANNTVKLETIEAGKYSAWVEGKLVFRGDPMDEVARRIERWYNVDVKLMDKELENYVIRGTFQDDSLEDVFRYLSMTSPISYHIIDRKVLDDGTFQKKKVLLYKKKN